MLFRARGGEMVALTTSLVVAELALLFFVQALLRPTIFDQSFWQTMALSAISSTSTYLACQINKKEPAVLSDRGNP